MMFKRNDGYALSYVLVVLMVLAIIATAVMAPPLRNLQMQQASIERMQEKYAAQGMVEQVVAQLDGVAEAPAQIVNSPCTVNIDTANKTYTIEAKCGKTKIEAVIELKKFSPDSTTYAAIYTAYNTEVAP